MFSREHRDICDGSWLRVELCRRHCLGKVGKVPSMGNLLTRATFQQSTTRPAAACSALLAGVQHQDDGPDLLPPGDERLYALHYSSDGPQNTPSGTPSILAIVVQHVVTGQQEPFAALRIAERWRIPPTEFVARQPELERQLLADFFAFVAEHPSAVWLNWYMHDSRFGFSVIDQRGRVHGLDVPLIPLAQRFDLANYLKRRHGPEFVPHPQLLEALKLNGLDGPGLLDRQGAGAAWGRGDHAALLTNLAVRVSGIVDLFECVRRETFRFGPGAVNLKSHTTEAGTASAAAADEFRVLMEFAATRLKGIERRVIELVCERGGVCPIADLACDRAIEWGSPHDNAWKSTQKRINLKLRKQGWKLARHGNAAIFQPIGRK